MYVYSAHLFQKVSHLLRWLCYKNIASMFLPMASATAVNVKY